MNIQVEGELGVFPYGKTGETGAVRIEYEKDHVKVELIENLANLINYGPEKLRQLKTDFEELTQARASVDAYKEAFLLKIRDWRAL